MRYSFFFSVSCSSLYENLPSYVFENTCRTNEDNTFCSIQLAVLTDVHRLPGKTEEKGTIPE